MKNKLLPLGTRVSWNRQFRPIDYYDQEYGEVCYEAVEVDPPRRGIIVGRRVQYDYAQAGEYSDKERIKGSGKPYYLCAYDLRYVPVKVPDAAITIQETEE